MFGSRRIRLLEQEIARLNRLLDEQRVIAVDKAAEAASLRKKIDSLRAALNVAVEACEV